jgi:hypothetical protein
MRDCLPRIALLSTLLGALLVAQPARALDEASVIQAKVKAEHPEIPAAAVTRAFDAYTQMESRFKNRDYVTIIDFDLPSTQKRMYVIDMKTGEVESYLTAHGKNSGFLYARAFSNDDNSDMSSLGLYATGPEYVGKHGPSMRLFGLESTNSNAYAREIVMHAADYVSPDWVAKHEVDGVHYLGRSWGCPAVETEFRDKLIGQLRNGSVFLIYHSQ